jgi:hypothetical protein
MLREVPAWAAWAADKPWYYLQVFAREAPLLWPLLPAAALVALLTHRRLACYCIVIVLVALLVHSIAAAKQLRYVYYVLPFVCALYGLAIAGLAARLTARNAAMGLLAVVCLTLSMSGEGQRAARLAVGRATLAEALPYTVEPDWTPVAARLRELAADDAVGTSNAMKSLYYLGRYDFELNASIVAETDTRAEFGRDERTGRTAISTPDSLARILDRGATLLVLETETIDLRTGVTAEAMALVRSRCTAQDLGAGAPALQVWHCNPGSTASP